MMALRFRSTLQALNNGGSGGSRPHSESVGWVGPAATKLLPTEAPPLPRPGPGGVGELAKDLRPRCLQPHLWEAVEAFLVRRRAKGFRPRALRCEKYGNRIIVRETERFGEDGANASRKGGHGGGGVLQLQQTIAFGGFSGFCALQSNQPPPFFVL
jgi:hypothetical protein